MSLQPEDITSIIRSMENRISILEGAVRIPMSRSAENGASVTFLGAWTNGATVGDWIDTTATLQIKDVRNALIILQANVQVQNGLVETEWKMTGANEVNGGDGGSVSNFSGFTIRVPSLSITRVTDLSPGVSTITIRVWSSQASTSWASMYLTVLPF